jgi:hypothetical protein
MRPLVEASAQRAGPQSGRPHQMRSCVGGVRHGRLNGKGAIGVEQRELLLMARDNVLPSLPALRPCPQNTSTDQRVNNAQPRTSGNGLLSPFACMNCR